MLGSLQDLEGFWSFAQAVQGKRKIMIERLLVRVSFQGSCVMGDSLLQISFLCHTIPRLCRISGLSGFRDRASW